MTSSVKSRFVSVLRDLLRVFMRRSSSDCHELGDFDGLDCGGHGQSSFLMLAVTAD
jgi:hypothetical protein